MDRRIRENLAKRFFSGVRKTCVEISNVLFSSRFFPVDGAKHGETHSLELRPSAQPSKKSMNQSFVCRFVSFQSQITGSKSTSTIERRRRTTAMKLRRRLRWKSMERAEKHRHFPSIQRPTPPAKSISRSLIRTLAKWEFSSFLSSSFFTWKAFQVDKVVLSLEPENQKRRFHVKNVRVTVDGKEAV